MVEALLLGLVAFIAQSEYALGTSLHFTAYRHRAVDRAGAGGMYRPASLWGRRWSWRLSALSPLAPRSRPTSVTGGILGVAFAITSGAGTETALLLGLPIATR